MQNKDWWNYGINQVPAENVPAGVSHASSYETPNKDYYLVNQSEQMSNAQNKVPKKKRSAQAFYEPPHWRKPDMDSKNNSFRDTDKSTKTLEMKNKSVDAEIHQSIHPSNNKLTDQTTISRILDLANKHINSNFKTTLNEIYTLLYGENLSKEWLETLNFSVIALNANHESLSSNENNQVNDNDKKTTVQSLKNHNSLTFELSSKNYHISKSTNVMTVEADRNKLEKSKTHANDSAKNENLVKTDTNLTSIPMNHHKLHKLHDNLLNMSPKPLNLVNLGKEFDVIIQSIQNSTEIWGNIIGEYNSVPLKDLMNEMALFYAAVTPENVLVKENHFYVLPDGKSWHRVKCLKNNNTLVTVFFVDSGDTKSYPVEHLFRLDSQFCFLPAQAVKMTLTNLENFSESVSLKNILEQTLLKKTFNAKVDRLKENDKCVSVKLYENRDRKSSSVNDLLIKEICKKSSKKFMHKISTSLSAEAPPFVPEKMKKDSNSEINFVGTLIQSPSKEIANVVTQIKEKLKVEEHSSIPLEHPQVPDTYFDVTVVMAQDPDNFVIQMLREKTLHLKKMESELQTACIAYTGSKLTRDCLKVGNMCACKANENDLQWYRVYVSNIIDEKICTVYFVDYGRSKNINLGNLINLPKQFYKLPYQAVRAALYGIKPKFGEWCKTDQQRFKDLTDQKNFVGLVKSKKISTNEVVPMMNIVYELELIDTSTSDDVYPSKIMIDEGRAEKK